MLKKNNFEKQHQEFTKKESIEFRNKVLQNTKFNINDQNLKNKGLKLYNDYSKRIKKHNTLELIKNNNYANAMKNIEMFNKFTTKELYKMYSKIIIENLVDQFGEENIKSFVNNSTLRR